MILAGATMSASICFSSHMSAKTSNSNPCSFFSGKFADTLVFSCKNTSRSHISTFSPENKKTHFSVKASSSGYTEEPTTNVKFHRSLSLPGCSSRLSLVGTGYREKVFAFIGVKVYAAGLYVNQSISDTMHVWKGRSATQIKDDSLLFDSVFRAPLEKSLQIVLVRDIDGKTFWDALDEAISPRIKAPTATDKTALSTFRSIFQARPLKKGTLVFLTWLNPSKMLVCISSDGLPSAVDATIQSENVTSALYDVFFGGASVSPSLKASVATGLAKILK